VLGCLANVITQMRAGAAEVEQHHLKPSRLLHIHTRYYVRELRIKAYSQLLESYRSVTVANLCNAFGVDETFLDKCVFSGEERFCDDALKTEQWKHSDLSRFIAAGRLNCSIDKVNGIVETNRPDSKNALYEQAIKQGDLLLNRSALCDIYR
jgi:26S proteasome regulatory subunit N7